MALVAERIPAEERLMNLVVALVAWVLVSVVLFIVVVVTFVALRV